MNVSENAADSKWLINWLRTGPGFETRACVISKRAARTCHSDIRVASYFFLFPNPHVIQHENLKDSCNDIIFYYYYLGGCKSRIGWRDALWPQKPGFHKCVWFTTARRTGAARVCAGFTQNSKRGFCRPLRHFVWYLYTCGLKKNHKCNILKYVGLEYIHIFPH